MLDLQKKVSKSKKNNVRPGNYTAKVTNICWTPGYVKGKAITITYELVSSSGKSYPFEELFFNSRQNSRTDEFMAHLEAAGIDDINDFVGCTEEVTIAKTADAYHSFSTISDRQFISRATSNPSTAVPGTDQGDSE